RKLVSLHVLRVGVTGAAGIRDAPGIDHALRALGVADPVHAVAAHALGRARILLLQEPDAMEAVLVLGELVGGERRFEPAHEVRVAVAARAESRDPAPVLVA